MSSSWLPHAGENLPSFSPLETTIGALLLHHSTTVLLYNTGSVLGISSLLREALFAFPKTLSRLIGRCSALSDQTRIAETTPLLEGQRKSTIATIIKEALFSQGPLTVIAIVLSLWPTFATIAPEQVPSFRQPDPPFLQTGFGIPDWIGRALWVVLVGFLTGAGTRLGNGCTSGHMLCGLSRLSPRSMAAVAVFFPAAIVSHNITYFVRPDRVDHIVRQTPAWQPTYPETGALLRMALLAVASAIASATAPLLIFGRGQAEEESKKDDDGALVASRNSRAVLLTTFLASFEFGLGLLISGMASSDKVQSFLSIWPRPNGSAAAAGAGALAAFDPSLALVLLFGVGPSVWVNLNRGLLRWRASQSSRSSSGQQEAPANEPLVPRYAPFFRLPVQAGAAYLSVKLKPTTLEEEAGDGASAQPCATQAPRISYQYLTGAALFGIAWGLEGVCPGPGILRSVIQPVNWGAAWLVGFGLGSTIN